MEREKRVYHGTALHPHTILRYTGINTGKLLGYRVYPDTVPVQYSDTQG